MERMDNKVQQLDQIYKYNAWNPAIEQRNNAIRDKYRDSVSHPPQCIEIMLIIGKIVTDHKLIRIHWETQTR